MKILVIGELCRDIHVYGSAQRLCPEAPVPVFNPIHKTENDGMAGNVAANLRSLGAEVTLISNDEIIEKIRYVDAKSNHMIMREDRGDKVPNSFNIDKINFRLFQAVIVSDYCKGFLSLTDIYQISKCHKLTFLDTKKSLTKSYMGGYSFIKINETEWQRSMEDGNTLNDWNENLIVTLGERGAMYRGINFHPENTVSVHDVSGAGDTFLASLVYKYVETKDISDSIKFANKCAATVVARKGVSVI